MTVDPACGMEVDPDNPGATIEYNGRTFYFCSRGCSEQFEADPERYLATLTPDLDEVDGITTPRVRYGKSFGAFDLSVQKKGRLSVGDEVVFVKTITDEDVHKFAEATGDTNAIHLNEEFARRTRFGRRIVHGTLVAGLISAALASLPGITVYLTQSLEFRRPVAIGETLTTTCYVAEELDEGRYCLTTRIEKEDGTLVINGTATVLIDDLPALS